MKGWAGVAALPAHSLAGLVFARARANPGARAIATMHEEVPYGPFADLIVSFARHMRRGGVTAGSRLAIDLPPPILGTAAALACSLIGCCWTTGVASAEEARQLRLTHALALRPEPWAVTGLRVLRVEPAWTRPPQGVPRGPDFVGFRGPSGTWNIGRSSGTTGMVKYMALSEAHVADRVAAEPFYIDLPERPVMLCLFPPLSGAGIRATLRVLAMGGSVLFAALPEIYGKVAIDCVFGSPNQFSGFLATAPAAPAPAARIPAAAMVGASAGHDFFARMLGYFARVAYGYASTEVSTVCANVIDSVAALGEMAEGQISVGRPRPDTRVEIIDEAGAVLAAGEEGIIRIRTPRHVPGYLGERDLTALVFRDGWFHPGDTGYVDARGELHVTGRVNDQFNIGGVKLNAERIDTLVRALPGVADCVSFPERDGMGIGQIAAAVVLDGTVTAQAVALGLNAFLAAGLGSSARIARIHVLAAIPRNATGKVARHEVADLARRNMALPVA